MNNVCNLSSLSIQQNNDIITNELNESTRKTKSELNIPNKVIQQQTTSSYKPSHEVSHKPSHEVSYKPLNKQLHEVSYNGL
jgi:hypothetical protein